VLLAGPDGQRWRDAAAAAAWSGAPVDVYVLGEDLTDTTAGWADHYNAKSDGAVLVRPDGFVAFRARTMPEDPVGVLLAALTHLLDRSYPPPTGGQHG
jgi:hypothetical protein